MSTIVPWMRFHLPIHLLGLAWLWRDCPSRKCVTSRFLWGTCNQSWHKLLRMAAIKAFRFYCVTWRNSRSCTLNNQHFRILECLLISDSSTYFKKKLWSIFFQVYLRVLLPFRPYQALNTEWRYQNFDRNRYRDFFSETKFFETETETLKNLAKVSRPRPKPRLLNIFWNEIRKIWDLQAKLEFLGPKFGTLIVNWVKIISAR